MEEVCRKCLEERNQLLMTGMYNAQGSLIPPPHSSGCQCSGCEYARMDHETAQESLEDKVRQAVFGPEDSDAAPLQGGDAAEELVRTHMFGYARNAQEKQVPVEEIFSESEIAQAATKLRGYRP